MPMGTRMGTACRRIAGSHSGTDMDLPRRLNRRRMRLVLSTLLRAISASIPTIITRAMRPTTHGACNLQWNNGQWCNSGIRTGIHIHTHTHTHTRIPMGTVATVMTTRDMAATGMDVNIATIAQLPVNPTNRARTSIMGTHMAMMMTMMRAGTVTATGMGTKATATTIDRFRARKELLCVSLLMIEQMTTRFKESSARVLSRRWTPASTSFPGCGSARTRHTRL